MPKFSDDQLDASVLHFIRQHRGKANPIGRWELVAKIFGPVAAADQNDDNFADRQIRESVMRLRRRGALICDMGDGRGRYLADSVEEYQAFRQYFGAAAFEKLATVKEMDKAADQEWPSELQPRLI
ncbi:MAG: hypothetical protein HY867_06265 [Chloroflexi bacterium]|nr:hypothetical protein [Chloroflexota bacterium]